MNERALIAGLLAPIATHPAARGLTDDAAVLTPPLGRDIVLTHDMLAEGVHFLAHDPPGTIAHKLAAVNLSDLAAMGARPLGVLLGLGLSAREDAAWLAAFTDGLAAACARWGAPLLGGDTIMGLDRAVLGLTAVGQVAPGMAPSRGGARAGDELWVSGSIGDAGLGLALARAAVLQPGAAEAVLIARYRTPEPRLALGAALTGLASACLDVSDGLLIDTERLAQASGVRLTIELARMPLSRAAEPLAGNRIALATSGDDYELLFTVPVERAAEVVARGRATKTRVTRIGSADAGKGLTILGTSGEPVTPDRLGWEHRPG